MATRREFLQTAGVLTVSFPILGCSPNANIANQGSANIGNRLRLFSDGRVELLLGKVELGQGIGTALVQIAAEELDVSVDRVRLMPVDTLYSPDESYTYSSISIQQSGNTTRQAAATARDFLVKQAQRKGVDTVSVDAVWPQLLDENIQIDSDAESVAKSSADYRVVGQSVPRLDIPGKVFGKASYLQDLRLPGMLHARVVRPAAERATIESLDTSAVSAMPGVIEVIRDGNFLAIVADNETQARRAAASLEKSVTWKLPNDLPDENAIYAWLKAADLQVESVAEVKPESPIDRATTHLTASYQRAYQAHASISPSAAIAQFDGGQLTVWSHAQGMYPLREALASVLELPIRQIRCLHFEASGCYGHNGADDAACDAAAIAMHHPGQPIRLQWERRDEMAWEPYGSAMQIDVDANIDDAGGIRRWRYDVWSTPHASRPRNAANAANMIYAQHKESPSPLPPIQSIPQPNGGADRNAVPLYAFDEVAVTKHLVKNVPMRVSALRGLGAYANVFAIESFMDELAIRFDVDPLEYRLRHLNDERAVAVLQSLSEVGRWQNRDEVGEQEGWGLGFARFKNRSSYLGVLARVVTDASTGSIQVKEVVAVCDAGLVVNPDGVRAQIEGGIVQSCSWTLKERVRFDSQRKNSVDWASYPILRFDEVPDVHVELLPRDDQPALGVGETAQGPTAAAIANAVFAATGRRLRRLPLNLA